MRTGSAESLRSTVYFDGTGKLRAQENCSGSACKLTGFGFRPRTGAMTRNLCDEARSELLNVGVEMELSLLDAALTPTVGVSAPLFFVYGQRLGVSAEHGMRLAIRQNFFYLTARGALVHFPRVPAEYEQTAFIPAFGSELRL